MHGGSGHGDAGGAGATMHDSVAESFVVRRWKLASLM